MHSNSAIYHQISPAKSNIEINQVDKLINWRVSKQHKIRNTYIKVERYKAKTGSKNKLGNMCRQMWLTWTNFPTKYELENKHYYVLCLLFSIPEIMVITATAMTREYQTTV